MLVSTKGRYAVRMLLDIAQNQKDGYVTMKDISQRQQISKKYLETFTAQLASAGILSIRRGKTGGYRLMREPEEITLLDVVTATEGPIHAVACLECEPNQCPRAASCASLPAWKGLEEAVINYLTSVTLRQLLDVSETLPPEADDYSCCL